MHRPSSRLPLATRHWPTPPTANKVEGSQIQGWLDELANLAPAVLALTAVSRPEQRLPTIWVAYPHGDARKLHTLIAHDWSQLFALSRYLESDGAPFVVMPQGQAQLHQLAPAQLAPVKLGCLRSAVTLLARARGESIPASLAQMVAQQFDANLPGDPAFEVDCLLPLMQSLTPKLRELGLSPSFLLESRLLAAVVAMESAGMPLDAAAYERIAQGWVQERQQCDDPNRARRLDKLLSTYRYWARDYLDADGRIRCQLDPLATESGRFSCASPNLQQVPNAHTAPGLRACFRPEPGFCFVVADYAQIELRVAAHIAGCVKLRQVFEQGQDPHRTTAATLRGCTPQEVSPADRKLAKAINFGFLFGMGARRFASYAQQSYGLELSDLQAKAAKNAFLSSYPGIAAWQKRTAALGQTSTKPVCVRTAMGRIKYFAANAFRFNAALNIPVQGTAAEGFKKAMLRLHRELPDQGARGVLCIHDEYIAEVPIHRSEAIRDQIVTVMEQEMQSVVPSVPIRANASICETWT